MKNYLSAAAVAAALAFSPALATSASAAVQSLASAQATPSLKPIFYSPIAALDAASNATISFDVTGIFSNDLEGSPINEVFLINIGANSEVIGIGWDVVLFADSPSWLSEMVVSFGGTSGSIVNLTPGVGDNFPGVEAYSSGGVVDLIGLGLNFTVDGDGFLRLEFFEAFDDFFLDWDGIWEEGALTIEYRTAGVPGIPEPATWAMMIAGFGLVGFAARRRRETVSA